MQLNFNIDLTGVMAPAVKQTEVDITMMLQFSPLLLEYLIPTAPTTPV